mmetsp:Transcript_10701/g.26854  ORF Transcript_10701/g.26854 Transcript_10701/m.26854 type:complete len:133 (+) Transcript_10701:269-667(+)
MDSADDVMDRLAVVHMVHEARGLDTSLPMLKKMESNGDSRSADCLREIYEQEIDHVRVGMKWFRYISAKRREAEGTGMGEADADAERRCVEEFHAIVRSKFRGGLKPPFNTEAREKAGFTEDWYLPLVHAKK